jgi:hypothetical protein
LTPGFFLYGCWFKRLQINPTAWSLVELSLMLADAHIYS